MVADGLRTGHASLEEFRGLLNRRLPFLSHIKLSAVYVVDHLGQNIPVPAMFCSTWKVYFFPSLFPSVNRYLSVRLSIILSKAIARIASEITT